MSQERRTGTRIPLDSLFFIEIRFNDENVISCLVLDISVGGLRVGVPAGYEDIIPDIGAKGVITDISPEIAELIDFNLGVTLKWIKEGIAGFSVDNHQQKVFLAFEDDEFK